MLTGKFTRRQAILWIISLGTWLLYLRTLAPTVTVDDSGDFTLAAYFFGAAHPPGYPAFVLLSRLFVLLPMGDVAFRVNLLTAVAGVLSVVLVYFLVEELVGSTAAAAFAAGIFAVSASFWRLATYAEVGTAMTAAACALLYFFVRWRKTERFGFLMGSAFLTGISAGVHYVPVLISVVLFGMLLCLRAGRKYLLSFKPLLICIGLFSLGFTVFAVLPIRSNHAPRYDWGAPGNWEQFKAVVSRAQYSDVSMTTDQADRRAKQAGWLVRAVNRQLGPSPSVSASIGFFSVLLLGVAYLWRKDRWLTSVLLVTSLFPMFFLTWVLNFDLTALDFFYVDVFFLPSYAVVFAFSGLGIFSIKELLSHIGERKVEIVLLAVLFSYPLGMLCSNYAVSDRRNSLGFFDMARSSLRLLPTKGLLLVKGDPYTFCMWYVQDVLGRDRQKPIVNGTLMDIPWYIQALDCRYPGIGHDIRALNTALVTDMGTNVIDRDKKDAWRVKKKSALVDQWLGSGGQVFSVFNDELDSARWYMEPWGVLYRVHDRKAVPETEQTCSVSPFLWARCLVRGLKVRSPGIRLFEAELIDQVAVHRYNVGTVCSETGQFALAGHHLDQAVVLAPARSDIHVNKGLVLYNQGKTNGAIDAFKRSVECDPASVLGWRNLLIMLESTGNREATIESALEAGRALRNHPDKSNALIQVLQEHGYVLSVSKFKSAIEEQEQ